MRFGNSPGVRRELAEGLRSLPGWCKGVRQKKTETHRKIVGGSQNTCRDSLGDSPKESGSSLETCREIVGRRPEDSQQECRRMLDWWDKPSVNDRCTAVAHAFGQLTAVDPPRLRDSTACTQESRYFRWLTCPYPSVRAAKSPRSTGE
ncbi:hypothetical protein B296_00051919 [Ensete ventricosum]|uniref:Uncharacterized protein n=1 Tax=Ensete ventricosum TaxID=4639 RepID=A0A426Y4Y1_ENSVE|nr:hypothetical protein B296_00051919 [Ensete ventricosum]